MKTLSLIPKKVKETYQIDKHKNSIDVHSPAYVNIEFDERFKVFQDNSTFMIKNNKCIVNLWKKSKKMHITIY